MPYGSRAFLFTDLTKIEVTEDTGIVWAQSDHSSFSERGIPFLFFHESHLSEDPYYDTPNDTMDNLNVPMFVGSMVQQLFNYYVGQGGGDECSSSIIKLIENWGGVKINEKADS